MALRPLGPSRARELTRLSVEVDTPGSLEVRSRQCHYCFLGDQRKTLFSSFYFYQLHLAQISGPYQVRVAQLVRSLAVASKVGSLIPIILHCFSLFRLQFKALSHVSGDEVLCSPLGADKVLCSPLGANKYHCFHFGAKTRGFGHPPWQY